MERDPRRNSIPPTPLSRIDFEEEDAEEEEEEEVVKVENLLWDVDLGFETDIEN